MKGGKPDGITKIYDEKGFMLGEESYKEGYLHGTMILYYPNEKIMKSIKYENGSKVEESLLEYYSNGELKMRYDSIYPIIYNYDSLGRLVMKNLVDQNNEIIDYVHFDEFGSADYEAKIATYLDFSSDTIMAGEEFKFVINSASLNNFDGEIVLDFKKNDIDFQFVAERIVDEDLGYFEYSRLMEIRGKYSVSVSVAHIDPVDTVDIYTYNFLVL
ncbi:hypothetical protein [Reichenbachiella sp.]